MARKEMSKGLAQGLHNVLPKPIAKIIQPVLFKILAIDKIDEIHDGGCNSKLDANFAEKILHKDVMNIALDVSDSDMKKIPKEGPLVIVSNHPYGGVDGIALLALLKRIRDDVKLMANYILGGIPEMKEYFFLVDPFGKSESSRKSVGGIRDTLKWLRNGHMLGLFPAGEVSTYSKEAGRVIDKEWGEAVGMMIQRGKCPVQCVFFEGQNSKFFHFLGKINPVLRTMWLPRELKRLCNHDLKINIGDVIPYEKISEFKTSKELMDFLKKETYALEKKTS